MKESRTGGGVEEQVAKLRNGGREPTRSDSTQLETYSNSWLLKIPRVRDLGFEARSEEA